MQIQTPEPVLLKERDVRAMLRIGRSTYYELISTGRLRSVRINRSVFVPRDAIDDFINGLPSASKAERDRHVA
jgi:excisionase family DNA binding protein